MRAFGELFEEGNVVLSLGAADREGVLQEMVGALVQSKTIARKEGEKVLEALLARERHASTGIGGGVAIPHVKSKDSKGLAAALGISRAGVDFRSVDGEPVHIVFLVVRPETNEGEHLRFLRWVSGLARDRDFRRFVLSARTPAEVVALLREMAQAGAG